MAQYTVVSIRQVDGVRYLALTSSDAQSVRSDRTTIDAVKPHAVLDVIGGARTWERTLGCPDLPEARDAIRAHLAELAEST